MALKMELETLDGLADNLKPLYIEKDGKFLLDVDAHGKPDDNKIPLSRLQAELDKKKALEGSLKEIADGFVNQIPEEFRDLLPDLPPAAKIKWIQQATAKGLFESKAKEPIDPKRPGDKPPANTENMGSIQLIEHGLKNQKK